MIRISILPAIALAIAMIGSGAAPASAASLQSFDAHKEQMIPHLHPVNSPGKTMFRPPSKKRA